MRWADGEYDLVYYFVEREVAGVHDEIMFTCEPRDHYKNIYTGEDVEITFYRGHYAGYMGADGARKLANAFNSYLTDQFDHTKYSGRSVGWYTIGADGEIEDIYFWVIDGWDVNDSSQNIQALLDREFWMNSDATGLILEPIGYGTISDTWDQAWRLGCSHTISVQNSGKTGISGFIIGFHFVEGTDDHTVRRYCLNEPR